VRALGLSARVRNRLVSAGINTIGDLVDTTPDQVLAIPNLGVKGLDEIYETLARRDLSLVRQS
jgi:DNA-directed RNA polymerase subunit alpha